MVIDVEGYEENVLKGFAINKYKPSIIIIEICDQHSELSQDSQMMKKYKKLRQYFKNNNYTLLVNDTVDSVYVSSSIFETLGNTFISNIRKAVQ